MRKFGLTVLAVLGLFLAYNSGYNRGSLDCPARAEAEAAKRAAIDRDIAEAMSASTETEAVCHQIFELVGDEIERQFLSDQVERANMGSD